MVDNSTEELRNYKFFCFGGICKYMKVDFDRFIGPRANYYDFEGNKLDFGEVAYPSDSEKNIIMPNNTDKMIELAEKLSSGIPFLRADFYDVNGNILFGELTFFPASGFGALTSEIWDSKLGRWINLPNLVGGYCTSVDDYIIVYHPIERKAEPELKDYKLYCFDGKVKLLMIASNRMSKDQTYLDYFDRDYNHLPIMWGNLHSKKLPSKPKTYDEMIRIAEILSRDLPHVRVDLYECNNRVYFGEMAFFDGSCFTPIVPQEWDYKLGEWLHLSERE